MSGAPTERANAAAAVALALVMAGCASPSGNADPTHPTRAAGLLRVGDDFNDARARLAQRGLEIYDPWSAEHRMAWAWNRDGEPHETMYIPIAGGRSLVVLADGLTSVDRKRIERLEVIENSGGPKKFRVYRDIRWIDIDTWAYEVLPWEEQ